MQLTLQTDYALRTLIFVGVQTESSTIAEIADRYHISKNHLVKVVHRLSQLGYLNTTRGRNGGVRLAMAPEDVSISEVVRQIEPGFNIVACFENGSMTCPITPSCVLKSVLNDAKNAFLQTLDSYTLADLLVNAENLRADLGFDPVSADETV